MNVVGSVLRNYGRLLAAASFVMVAGLPAQALAAAAEREITVDQFSVVKLTVKAVPDARSTRTLGPQREGTGVVIDSSGLVLTIGYLVAEADTVELATADGRKYPANVIGYDNVTGLGLVKSLKPLPVKPVDFGESAVASLRDLVLIVGFDGVAPAYIVSKRPFVGYWEYLLDEAIYTAPATVNWQGAALLSREGKLLGIGSLAVGDAMGKGSIPGNMFVPIDTLKPVLGDFIANGRSTTKPRPWLGITSQEVQGKVIVTRVSSEGPAEEAGLKPGDIIVGIGGQALSGQADFYSRLWKSGNAGVEISLDVLKGTKVEAVKLKSMAREEHFRSRPVY
jgi:serine protease Do